MKKPHSLIKQITPEEIELETKRAELSGLEEKLALKELDLTTLQVGLEDLRRRYLRIVGVKLASLDEINAQIAEALARVEPENKKLRRSRTEPTRRSSESADRNRINYGEEYKKNHSSHQRI